MDEDFEEIKKGCKSRKDKIDRMNMVDAQRPFSAKVN